MLDIQLIRMFNEYFSQVFHPSKLQLESGLYPLWVGALQALPNYKCDSRILDNFYLIYVKKGAGRMSSSGQTFPLHSGNIFFLFPGVIHSYRTSKTKLLELLWIGFDGFLSSKLLNEIDVSPLKALITIEQDKRKELEEIMLNLIYFQEKKRSGLVASGLLYQLFGCLHSYHNQTEALILKEKTLFENKPIERALTYIDRNFRKTIRIYELARITYMSRTNFTKRFKKETGLSPSEYINRLRIVQAQYLLLTNITVKEAAHGVGFEDEYYFSRWFSKRTGVSPTEYKKQQHPKQRHIIPRKAPL